MKLEDCTKEELIYLLNRRCWSYIKSTSELEFDILMYRAQISLDAAQRESKKSIKSLGEYIELLKPYQGQRLIDIPENIIKKASEAMERYKKCQKSEALMRKQYDKIQKQIDLNLNRGETLK